MTSGLQNSRLDRVPPSALVIVGAVAGTLLRSLAEGLAGDDYRTVAIACLNIVGSALVGWLSGRTLAGTRTWLFGAVGFGGGLTTFSTYVVDVAERLDDQHIGAAFVTGAATVVLALTAAAAGRTAAIKSVGRARG